MRYENVRGAVQQITSPATIRAILDADLGENFTPFYDSIRALASQVGTLFQSPAWRDAYARCSLFGMLALYEHTALEGEPIEMVYQIIATKLARLPAAEQNQWIRYIERQIRHCDHNLAGLAARYCRLLQHLRVCQASAVRAPAQASTTTNTTTTTASAAN
jgi:hypothetical protein